jgi:hypothetical protein
MPWAEALFWVGLVVMFAPIAARLASVRALPRERLVLVVSLGLGLYGVKVLQNPLYFTYFDELLHLRTAQDIVRSGRLFSDNPLLLVGPYYPGLEIVVTALSVVTGWTIFAAAIAVLAVARLVLVLALYLLYQRISGSARVASIASAMYMANPHFLFFDAAFAYESLALAFATLTLVAVARRRAPGGNGIGSRAVIVMVLGASIITHHVTAAFLVGFLGLWAATSRFSRRLTRSAVTTCPAWPALLGSAAVVAWALLVATPVVDYLGGPALEVVDTVRRLVGSSDAAAEALGTLSRPVQRPWERFASYFPFF